MLDHHTNKGTVYFVEYKLVTVKVESEWAELESAHPSKTGY